MAEDAAKVAATYFDAWRVNDFDTMRSLLDDVVTFVGPLAQLDGVDDYIKGIEGTSRITSEIVVRKTFVDGPDVLTWYDLHTMVAPPVPAANWLHVEDARSRPCGWRSTLENSPRKPNGAMTRGAAYFRHATLLQRPPSRLWR